jgi:hypothetical protein
MKFDAGFGVEGGYLRNAGDAARAAESVGFAGLWSSETRHDAFLPLALAADATDRIKLGTSVAIAFSRFPMVSEPRCGSSITMGRLRARLSEQEVTALEVSAP